MASRTIKVVLEMTGEKKVSSGIKRQKVAIDKLKMSTKQLGNTQRKAVGDAVKLKNATKGLTNQFIRVNLASRAISLGIHQLSSAFTFGVTSAIDFGFTIKKISAISGVAGLELKSLEDTIKAIASVSPKTSTQVAQAALEMSKMGLAGKDLENSLAGVVNLSVALDEEVASVGQTMLSVKNIFNKDASEMTAIADQMFTTLGNSALNLEKFSTAFAFAGASARLSGVSFEQTSAMMGVLADNGVKASTIGTQLRQVFTRLDDPTSKVSKLLGEQSIKTRGLSETLMILKGVIKNSGDAKELFGQRAIGVIDILTREGTAIEALTSKIKEMEKSTLSAAKMLSEETTKGALDRFKSAWELAFINLGESSDGFWTKFFGGAADAMKAVADMLDDVMSESQFVKDHVNKNFAEIVKDRKFEDIRSLSPFLLASEREILEKEGKEAYKKYIKDLSSIAKGEKPTVSTATELPALFPKTQGPDRSGFDAANKALADQAKLERDARVANTIASIEKKQANADALVALQAKIALFQKEVALNKAKVSVGIDPSLSGIATQQRSLELESLAKKNGLIKEQIALLNIVGTVDKQWAESMIKATERQAEASEKEIENSKKLLELQIQSTEGYQTQMSLFPEFADAFGEMASKMEIGITALNTAVGGLSSGLTDLAFGGTLEEFGKAMLSTLKSIVNGFIEAAIRAAIFKAVLGIATAGTTFTPAGGGIGGLTNFGNFGAPTPSMVPGVFPGLKASGFEGVVTQPTTFTVGEEGAEEVMVRPRAKMSAGSDKGAGMTVIIQGDINGEEQFIDRIRSANEEIERRSA